MPFELERADSLEHRGSFSSHALGEDFVDLGDKDPRSPEQINQQLQQQSQTITVEEFPFGECLFDK